MDKDIHHDVVRFRVSAFQGTVPESIADIDELPKGTAYTIRDVHRRCGFDGPVEIVSAGRLAKDPQWFEVITLVRRV